MNKDLLAIKTEHVKERGDAAWRIGTLLMNHQPIVYVDETSVVVNQIKTKTWQRNDAAVYAARNNA